jgi:hypothetical protein
VRVAVRTSIDRQAVGQVVAKYGEPALARAAQTTANRARARITGAGRVDRGTMRARTAAGPVRRTGQSVTVEVRTAVPYAVWQHEGTGVHAGRGRIYPRRAKMLRFRPKGSGTFVFARSVAGVKGVPYLKDALNSLTISDFR